jgi:hypothetical protein
MALPHYAFKPPQCQIIMFSITVSKSFSFAKVHFILPERPISVADYIWILKKKNGDAIGDGR